MKKLILIALMGLSLAACETKPKPNRDFATFAKEAGMAPEEPGQLAMDFEYKLLGGPTEKLSDNRGKFVFLNFWATWCYPCKQEMPDIEKLLAHMQGKPFRVLAVSVGEGAEKVAPFKRDFPYSFDFVLDGDAKISDLYKVRMLPTTLLIDPQGRIIAKAVGPRQWAAEEFYRELDPLVL
ncbi:MAG: hypothetical protein A2600_08425 [Candidatus Lambdaproteobacteria bacterium RIFOXYD1_FULL_56_27]|uniref:Thioredoxin domain-containing protein n=1 Tax=Candidatus Lambdaproteobacteria bacterium RIFOXYD2_FULL_56_26 TaxID=1817773 RepID=A0A1F6H0G5_9PROT|nr:MAG: hypothetical protein A2426_06655 [Candidatus Lambdaproteobacteria bacterium RIFOXYC1_FULL_56_13]OGH03811.1 MAG: hypothetical protein A2557_13755 [Candidatus Lambdaproteobacteria bacterium RIFOXYD2_FULL_56_26]OGH08805.1 MAG: hypothetical protein A2600_08425 [Candidatus Lambdaproteobacteria bacterium RIFOXYD1_FULL_56_27]